MYESEHKLNIRKCGIHGTSTASGRCADCDRERNAAMPEEPGGASASPAGWDVAEPGPEQGVHHA